MMHGATDANQSPNRDDAKKISSDESVESGSLNEPAWSADVLKQEIFQTSKTKLDRRLTEFLKIASPEEMRSYEESRQNLLKIVQQAQDAHDNRYSDNPRQGMLGRIKNGCQKVSEVAYPYTQIMDVFVGQAPDYVGLVYGAVKILLVAQISHGELKEKVKENMEMIKTKFEIMDHLTSYHPTEQLVQALGRFYDCFQRFVAKALKFYCRSRLKNAFKAFTKPWTQLEPIVQSIDQVYSEVRDIIHFSNHFTGQTVLTKVSQILDFMTENTIRFSKASDFEETCHLFQQRVDAKMEEHGVGGTAVDTAKDFKPSPEPNSMEDSLSMLFTDLNKLEHIRSQKFKMEEQRPEMHQYRSTKRNILKVDHVMDWVEAQSSQLLWVDGNNSLRRETFSASFVAPILLLGENHFETSIVLRHFCGDSHGTSASTYPALIQSLLTQLFKQRADLWASASNSLDRESASNIRVLWKVLASSLQNAQVPCVFIVIDSIDSLASQKTADGVEERDFVIEALNTLVKQSTLLVKVLLTASLSHTTQLAGADNALTLSTLSYAVQSQNSRKLSSAITGGYLMPVSHKFVEIQERRCKSIRFTQLPLLYQINSTIYCWKDKVLQAFVVSELSGMDPGPLGTYGPLVLRVWAVDHNGKTFVRRFYDFQIPFFAREIDIADLSYIPTGYLPDENQHRMQLIRRGRRYWELGSAVHFMEDKSSEKPERVVIDQTLRPSGNHDLSKLDVELRTILDSNLKPFVALTCPPTISGYDLTNNTWREIDVLTIQDVQFQRTEEEVFADILLRDDSKYILRGMIGRYRGKMPISDESVLIMLHGGPGVGKTFTVNLTAEYTRRPLISISMADIFKTGQDGPRRVRAILKMASHWNALVSLENVELLSEDEDKQDSPQHANVLSIIQILERHHGLVFLITDRIGAVNMNLITRTALAINLPPLDESSQIKILHSLAASHDGIARKGIQDAASEWRLWKTKGMNGWQIQQGVTAALELSRNEETPFDLWLLEKTFSSQVQLQSYLWTLGRGDSDAALKRNHRNDSFVVVSDPLVRFKGSK